MGVMDSTTLEVKRCPVCMEFKDLREFTKHKQGDLQVLCANCNWAKRYGDCPHQKRGAL